MVRLRDALEECTLALLRRIAAGSGMPVDDSVLRAELIDALHDWLCEPGRLAGGLSRLTPQEMEALSLIRRDGWTSRAFVLDRSFPRGSASATGPQAGISPSLSLLQRGILFRGFDTVGEWRGEVYYVPDELRSAVGGVLPPPSSVRGPDLSAPPPPYLLEAPEPAHDAFCLLSFLRRENRRLVRNALTAADLAKLDMEARGGVRKHEGTRDTKSHEGIVDIGLGALPRRPAPGTPRWHFLLHLCRAGGWVRKQGATLKPSRTAQQLLRGGAAAVRSRLLETYLRDRVWSDLEAAGRVSQPVGSQRIREAQSRRLLLHHLEGMAGDGWTDPRAFVAALHDSAPDILRQDYSSLSWAVVDTASGVELQGPESWQPVEGEWISYLLRGPLEWLGLIQWGVDARGERVAFRLRPRIEEADAGAGSAEAISIDAGLNVAVRPGSDLSVAYRLEPYLELRRRGQVSAYRMTRASVLRGLEEGGSWEDLEALLGQCEKADPEEEVISRVREWATVYGRYTLEVALLLTAETQEEADGLRDVEGLRACLEARLGPRSYRVQPERVWELIERLRRSGHSPKVAGNPRIPGARQALQDAELLKQCLFALRLVAALRPNLAVATTNYARRLEALFDPKEVREIGRRVDEALGKPPGN